MGLNPKESTEDYFNRKLGLIPSPTVSQLSAAAKLIDTQTQTSRFTQFVDGLKAANKGTEERLDNLASVVTQMLGRPQNLYVQSPSPVTDGAKIWSDISRQSIVAAGLD